MTTAIVLLTNQPYGPQVSFFESLGSDDYEVFVVDDDHTDLPPSHVTYDESMIGTAAHSDLRISIR